MVTYKVHADIVARGEFKGVGCYLEEEDSGLDYEITDDEVRKNGGLFYTKEFIKKWDKYFTDNFKEYCKKQTSMYKGDLNKISLQAFSAECVGFPDSETWFEALYSKAFKKVKVNFKFRFGYSDEKNHVFKLPI